ncbi:MAG TPA: M48 family metalloprotease [Acidimicrobiales bacterium]|nr:M48 family metalloprotease [Acidimicrobiales bacterium]
MGAEPRRATFFDEQRRHRRAGWRFSIMSAMAVLVLGLPLSVVISPFLVATGLVAMDAVHQVTPMPDPLAALEPLVDRLSATGAEPPTDTGEDAGDDTGEVEVAASTLAWAAAALVVPGIVAMFVVWRCVRRLFMRSGAGAVVLAAGARAPRPGDLEERQLVNLVEEMALAAGVPRPRVMLVDADVANAAVAGRSPQDFTVIVPRGLLDDLGRDATQAVVADLLAMVVDGDLRAALLIASVNQTFDLIGSALAAPLGGETRKVLWQAIRLALRRGPARGDGSEEHFIAERLTRMAQLEGLDPEPDRTGCVTLLFQWPFLVASLAWAITRLIFGGFLVSAVVAAQWRRRRLLADATAVELTRNPDALAAALVHLRDHGATVPAGPWTHLFVVGPEAEQERAFRRFERRRDEIWADERRPGESRRAALARRTREAIAATSEMQRDQAGGATVSTGTRPAPGRSTAASPVTSSVASPPPEANTEMAAFLPKLSKRLDRLEAMGARVPDDPGERWSAKPEVSPVMKALGWVVGILLTAIIAVLMLILVQLVLGMIYMALMFELALLAPLVLASHALLR